jgi:S1-C subfamily serine protease
MQGIKKALVYVVLTSFIGMLAISSSAEEREVIPAEDVVELLSNSQEAAAAIESTLHEENKVETRNSEDKQANESELDLNAVQNAKKGVVSISNNIVISANEANGTSYGTGFVIDKESGILITNKHVVDRGNISRTYVTFFNGKEVEARLLYTDPTHDFSFLAVAPEEIPADVSQLKFSKAAPKPEQPVFIIGNNQAKNFSLQSGTISSLYESSGFFPMHSLRISLNTAGGSSGSPILDVNGEVIALNYAVEDTYALALYSEYLQDALAYILGNQKPPRRDLGVHVSYYSLDKASRYNNLNNKVIESYLKEFPDSFNQALVVVQSRNPKIRIGDVLWQINGNKIGPNLYTLQREINERDNPDLMVYRNGELISLRNVETYDLYPHTIRRMVSFGGAIIYEVDHLTNLLTGADLGSIFISNVTEGSSFARVPQFWHRNQERYVSRVRLTSIGAIEINSWDDLMLAIKRYRNKRNFRITFENYGFMYVYNMEIYGNHSPEFRDIDYHDYTSLPKLYRYDEEKKEWIVEDIN